MKTRRTGWLVLVGAIVAPMFLVGCKAPPPRSPKILGSMRPPVGMQAPPVNSKTPVLVPTAPLAQARPVAPAYAVPAQTAVAVPVQQGVIAQPGGPIAVAPQGSPPQQMVAPQQSLPPRPSEATQANPSANRGLSNDTPVPERLEFPPEPN